MSAAGPCDDLLRLTDRSEPAITIRVIDDEIHRPGGTTPDEYREKQMALIARVRRCERAVFNDPRVAYQNRAHFNGPTGTMSNILTGTFYYLYLAMLERGVEVSAEDDLITLFYAAMLTDFGRMPPEDQYVVKSIIQNLLEKAQERDAKFTLFTSGWWATLDETMAPIIAAMRRGYTEPHRLFQSLFGESKVIFYYGPYEHKVNYVGEVYSPIMMDPWASSEPHVRAQLARVRQLFTGDLFNVIHGGRRSTRRRRRAKSRKSRKTT